MEEIMFYKKHDPLKNSPITGRQHPFIKKNKTQLPAVQVPLFIDKVFLNLSKTKYTFNYN